jgi:hypothetical protein
MSIDTTYCDIVDVISELNARGHLCDINAIEARLSYDWTDLLNTLKEMRSLKVLEYYRGEFFVIPQQEL